MEEDEHKKVHANFQEQRRASNWRNFHNNVGKNIVDINSQRKNNIIVKKMEVNTMTNYELQAEKFLEKYGLKLRIYNKRKRVPSWDNKLHNTYSWELQNSKGEKTSGKFYDSLYNTNKGILPTAYDILACLQKYDIGTIDDFIQKIGLNCTKISISQIRKTYKLVVKEYQGLCTVLGPDNKNNNAIWEDFREIQ